MEEWANKQRNEWHNHVVRGAFHKSRRSERRRVTVRYAVHTKMDEEVKELIE
jgi:hypothetical protein